MHPPAWLCLSHLSLMNLPVYDGNCRHRSAAGWDCKSIFLKRPLFHPNRFLLLRTHFSSPMWTCKEKETNNTDQGKVWVGRNLKNPRDPALALMPIINFINCLPVYGTQTWMQTQSKNLITSRNHFSPLNLEI